MKKNEFDSWWSDINSNNSNRKQKHGSKRLLLALIWSNWKGVLRREFQWFKMGLLKGKWNKSSYKGGGRQNEPLKGWNEDTAAIIGPSCRGLCRCLQTEYLNVSVICDTWRLVCRSLESSAISRVTCEESDLHSQCAFAALNAAARFSVRDNMECDHHVKEIEHEHPHLTLLWDLRTNLKIFQGYRLRLFDSSLVGDSLHTMQKSKDTFSQIFFQLALDFFIV